MTSHHSQGIPPKALGLGAVLVFLALALASYAGEPATAPEDSDPAAPLVHPASEFDPLDYQGKILLVDFWASWCKPCAHSLPWLAELQRRHGAQGLAVVAINIDTDLDKAAPMLDQLTGGIDIYHDADRTVAAAYDLEGMPSAYLYDRSGKLRESHVGFLPAEAEAREQEIVELLAEGTTE